MKRGLSPYRADGENNGTGLDLLDSTRIHERTKTSTDPIESKGKHVNHKSLSLIAILAGTLAACGGPSDVQVPKDTLAFFLTTPITPKAKKPSNADMVALGKTLYHDKRLSSDGTISCASCHSLKTFGVDNKATSLGVGGKPDTRNSPTTLNAFQQLAQFWDGRAATVEDQLLNPKEHGLSSKDDAVAILKKDPTMVEAFAKAFPGEKEPLNFDNIGNAIGAFERKLTTRSRFDKFLDGNKKALNNQEKQGLIDFVEAGCTTCHTSRMVGGQMMQKLGLVYAWPSKDLGRFQETKQASDKYIFKVPGLLNVEKTAPYLHDGSMKTLPEVIEMMAWNQLGKRLDKKKVANIEAFLKALTGKLPASMRKSLSTK